jgi:hypothetical protein
VAPSSPRPHLPLTLFDGAAMSPPRFGIHLPGAFAQRSGIDTATIRDADRSGHVT